MDNEINKLQKQNTELKQKLEMSKNKTIFLKFLSWINNDIKIKEIRKKIYEQHK